MTNSSGKKIFFLVADFQACGWYRGNIPGRALVDRGHEVKLGNVLRSANVPEHDVIVFQRQYTHESIALIELANSKGITTVYELDDDLWHLHKENPAHGFWNRPGVLRSVEAAIRLTQAVTTTTPQLASILSRYNRNVAVLPNMLPGVYWEIKKPEKQPDDPLVLGWAGSTSHWPDLNVMAGTVEQLLEEFPNLEFHVAGPDRVPFYKHERAKALESVDIRDYQKLLTDFDIGMAPLEDSQFNKCKSDLKYLEYAMLGIPVVASRVEAYTGSIINGENGFLAANTKDWLKYLRRLIIDENLRKTIAANAKEFAKTRTIEKNIGLWEKAYGIE